MRRLHCSKKKQKTFAIYESTHALLSEEDEILSADKTFRKTAEYNAALKTKLLLTVSIHAGLYILNSSAECSASTSAGWKLSKYEEYIKSSKIKYTEYHRVRKQRQHLNKYSLEQIVTLLVSSHMTVNTIVMQANMLLYL